MVQPDKSRFSGCLIGQCLGDALGFIVEGYPPDVCKQYVEESMRTGKMVNQSRGPFAFGQYSDDSQLARELLQSYMHWKKFSPTDYAKRIASIFVENRIVGRGQSTEEAAFRLAEGMSWKKAGSPPPSAGNGSAMRVGPIGLLHYQDREKMIKSACDQSIITHKDERCLAGCIAIAGGVSLVLNQSIFDRDDFVHQLKEWTLPYDHILSDAIGRLPQWIEQPFDDVAAEISVIGIKEGFSKEWDGISPFVTGSVLWSLYSFFKHPDNYWEAICTAIEVGGDVDTTAAMTGAISGANVGLENLPGELTKHLNDMGTWEYNQLVELAENIHDIVHGREPTHIWEDLPE